MDPHFTEYLSGEIFQCSQLSLWTYIETSCQSTPLQLANLYLVAKWEANNYELDWYPSDTTEHERTERGGGIHGGLQKRKNPQLTVSSFKNVCNKIIWGRKKNSKLYIWVWIKGKKMYSSDVFFFSLLQARRIIKWVSWRPSTQILQRTKTTEEGRQPFQDVLLLVNTNRSWDH